MKNFKLRFRNFISTFAGLLLSTPIVLEGAQSGDTKQILVGVGVAILGTLAKDK